MVGRRGPARVRVLIPTGGARRGGTVDLDEDESHHLTVRRVQPDEIVVVLDGSGLTGRGRVRLHGRRWSVDIDAVDRRPPLPPVTLAVGAGDRERFAWLVEKAAELGVTTIVPLETERAAAVATRLRERHLPKLRRAALQAIKQSGAAWAPDIEAPENLDAFLARPPAGARLLADAEGAAPPTQLDDGIVVVMIGPEGGFTDGERSRIVGTGAVPTALGPFTLRFETAGVAAAALVAMARRRSAHD